MQEICIFLFVILHAGKDAGIEEFSLDRDEIICDNSPKFIKKYIAYRYTIGFNHEPSLCHFVNNYIL